MSLTLVFLRLSPARLAAVIPSYEAWEALDLERGQGGATDVGKEDVSGLFDPLFFVLDPNGRLEGPESHPPSTPAGAAVFGWHEMHPEHIDDYGGHVYLPRYNTSEEVVEIAAALDSLDFDAALVTHEPALTQAKLSYLGWGHPLRERDRDDLRLMFARLRAFYAQAAQEGQGVAMFIH